MTFADMRNPHLFTDAEIAYAAEKYRIISLEKCTGASSNNTTTERAIYSTAKRLKAANPAVKVLFYLATDQQGLHCYNASAEFEAHPEWWLMDDRGNAVEGSPGSKVMDWTVAAARAWWTAIPLSGVDGSGMFDGVPVSSLIDGVLADGAGWSHFANISVARLEALSDAKIGMVADLQQRFHVANGGVVMANGISMYGGPNADPRSPDDHNVHHALLHVDAIMNEHTAVFESVNKRNASFNVETVAQDLLAIERAARFDNGSKTVFVQTWPGLYVTTGFTDGTVFPPAGEPSPRNNADWRAALRSHFDFAHALFLTIAQPNVFWMYAGYWYDTATGYLPCPDKPDSCAAPPEGYPLLDRPLGAPLGPRATVAGRPYSWRREFEHASVVLDLMAPNASRVTLKKRQGSGGEGGG